MGHLASVLISCLNRLSEQKSSKQRKLQGQSVRMSGLILPARSCPRTQWRQLACTKTARRSESVLMQRLTAFAHVFHSQKVPKEWLWASQIWLWQIPGITLSLSSIYQFFTRANYCLSLSIPKTLQQVCQLSPLTDYITLTFY